MSNQDFRRELNAVFDEMSGSPDPALRDRVRSSIAQAPAERGGPYWIAALAAGLIAALLIGVLFVAGPLKNRQSNAGPGVRPNPAASPAPIPETGQAFGCDPNTFIPKAFTTSGLKASLPPVAYVDALQVSKHPGYDRLVIEFANGMPSKVEVRAIKGTTFTMSPNGRDVTLKGENGVLVTMTGADLHTSYRGSTDITTGLPVLAEVRSIQDFKSSVQLGLGVNAVGCYRAFFVANPTRLVVDVGESAVLG